MYFNRMLRSGPRTLKRLYKIIQIKEIALKCSDKSIGKTEFSSGKSKNSKNLTRGHYFVFHQITYKSSTSLQQIHRSRLWLVLQLVRRFVMVVQRFLGLQHLKANVTFVHKGPGEVNVLNMVQQVVLQCHVLSTNGTLKATCAAFWSCYVSLQDVSIFQTWKCNSRLIESFDFLPITVKSRAVLERGMFGKIMYLDDNMYP